MTRRKNPSQKSLTKLLAEHPGAALTLLVLGTTGAGATAGGVIAKITSDMSTQQQTLDMKNELHLKEVDLLNTRAALEQQIRMAQHDKSEAGTGSTVRMTADIKSTE